jgi:hypothetical protein
LEFWCSPEFKEIIEVLLNPVEVKALPLVPLDVVIII